MKLKNKKKSLQSLKKKEIIINKIKVNNIQKKVFILQKYLKVKLLTKLSNLILKLKLTCQFCKKENMQQLNNLKHNRKNIEKIFEELNFKGSK